MHFISPIRWRICVSALSTSEWFKSKQLPTNNVYNTSKYLCASWSLDFQRALCVPEVAARVESSHQCTPILTSNDVSTYIISDPKACAYRITRKAHHRSIVFLFDFAGDAFDKQCFLCEYKQRWRCKNQIACRGATQTLCDESLNDRFEWMHGSTNWYIFVGSLVMCQHFYISRACAFTACNHAVNWEWLETNNDCIFSHVWENKIRFRVLELLKV